jgi:hypothetical protein
VRKQLLRISSASGLIYREMREHTRVEGISTVSLELVEQQIDCVALQ